MRPDSPDPDSSRRLLLGVLGAVAGFIGFRGTRLLYAQTSQAPANHPGFAPAHVLPTEPLAQSLGYKEDASQVDKAKFPTYKPGQKCATCRFLQGDASKPFAPCQIFGGKLVSTKGWCASYNAKT